LNYVFHTAPYGHQERWVREYAHLPAGAILFDMGAGKTKTLIDNAALLFERGEIDALLVVAPKSVYRLWIDQVDAHLPPRIQRRVVAMARFPETAAEKTGGRPIMRPERGVLHVLLLPISQLRITREKATRARLEGALFKVAAQFLHFHRSMIAVDESSAIKNARAAQTKGVTALRAHARFARILTGQPMPNSPLDLFAQYNFLDPNILRCSNPIVFQHRYAILKEHRNPRAGVDENGEQLRNQAGRVIPKFFHEIVGWKNLDELKARIAPVTLRVRKEDCLDLPPKTFMRREVELTPEQRSAYNDMAQMAVVELGDALVSAQHKITRLLRLHQIVCGYLPLPDGRMQPIRNNRLQAVLDWTEEIDGKVLIWAHYLFNIEQLRTALGEMYGPQTVDVCTGEVSASDRELLQKRFQDPSDPLRFLIGNEALARGFTLTACRDAGYHSNTYNLDTRSQSEDRIHRIGQLGTCTYTDFVTPGTVDATILRAHERKQHLARLVMDTPPENLIRGNW
jgi:SNF2 family DNA or RNA helicase